MAQTIGPYTLLEPLGSGGMGAVYVVRHEQLGVTRALKLMRRSDSERGLVRFEREARTLAGISHPNVVRIHDAGVEAGQPWFVMDRLEGESLDRRLRRGPLPWEEAARLVVGVAQGVGALHAAGVVHRDLKPANVVLTPEGTPVVIDLGLAVSPDRDDRLTQTGAVVGTLAYLAPEQFEGVRGTPRGDVYALGLILYELLTGAPAVSHHSSMQELATTICSKRRPRPRAKAPGVPRNLDALCVRAMALDPEERPADGAAMAEALEEVLRNPGATWGVGPWAVALGLGAVLAVGAAVLGVGAVPPSAPPAPSGSPAAPVATRGPKGLDDRQVREGAEQLRALRGREAVRERREGLQAWLTRYPGHPSFDAAQRLYDEARFGAPLLEVAHPNPVAARFLGDDRLATVGYDRRVRSWRLEDGALLREWTLDFSPSAVAVSPQGALVVGQGTSNRDSPGDVVVIDPDSDGAPTPATRAGGTINSICFDPSGARAAIAYGRTVGLYDYPSWRKVHLLRHGGIVRTAAFTPDGSELVTGCGGAVPKGKKRDHAVRLWEVATGQLLARFPMAAKVTTLDVSPSGDLVLAGNGAAQVVAIDLKGRSVVDAYAGDVDVDRTMLDQVIAHTHSVRTVAFSPGGGLAFSVSASRPLGGELRIWDTARGKELQPGPRFRRPPARYDPTWQGLALAPDGRRAVLYEVGEGGSKVQVWALPEAPPRD